jgi:hypothetical protein
MDTELREFFLSRWSRYFPGAGLPVCWYYTDDVHEEDARESVNAHRCMICNLGRVRDGFPFVYDRKMPGCAGGKRYAGFSKNLRANFEYFLSCGIPGELEGERYKKSPELVKEYLEAHPAFEAPGKYLVFKRWDKLRTEEEPFAVILFAAPDVLSGLFTLANFDVADLHGVVTPMGSGCSSIISYPRLEGEADHPRAVLGMFDVSARPCVPSNTLTFAVSMNRFKEMLHNMDESFLMTESWNLVRSRLSV